MATRAPKLQLMKNPAQRTERDYLSFLEAKRTGDYFATWASSALSRRSKSETASVGNNNRYVEFS